jgi:predicted GH43/DUF377 family glycosyl hydrolase
MKLKKYKGNPILSPIRKHAWEAKMVFNPACYYKNGVHIVYRAMDRQGVSKFGYAFSKDGFRIDERLNYPIYEPEANFECHGCEDPRITKIGDRLYMVYAGFDERIAHVALASIKEEDFLNKKWNWKRHGEIFPKLLPFRGKDDKDAFLFPEKINGKWLLYHRVPPDIWLSYSTDLKEWSNHVVVAQPRPGFWDCMKIGGGGPPFKTKDGWIFIYHGVTYTPGKVWGDYKLGMMITELKNPEKIRYRSPKPILEPTEKYELASRKGGPNVVFTCGQVVKRGKVLVYYGGGDRAIGVAEGRVSDFLLGRREK